jgi:hypothetical protein
MLFNDECHIIIEENIIEGHISCSESVDDLTTHRANAKFESLKKSRLFDNTLRH